ncbi:hypothetical protein PISL3812_02346 [Talaromyces islandicus]|uniref:Dystroglycan-type cadherin-like domain-containing protein n=1 Tax=Talaromyces islandicus TaxID=28573 RepID=A0A0U1LRX1_TALIS|nr:hypothetical protein PISL3812_02346 [Talaromyces islandicus]
MRLDKMVMSLCVALLVALINVVGAVPTVSYPINAQLPPVARVGHPFSFSFSSGTFAGGGAELTYSLSNAPEWLHVDTKNLTLYGTPQTGNVGAAQFLLVATDKSGSASMSVTLVVSNEPGPQPGKPILEQLAKSGPTTSPATIFMYPGHPFNIDFDPVNTFTNTQLNTVYYATSSPYNAPLPSWMTFDPSTLKFAGNTPSNPSSIPQYFKFNMIASDAAGFSGALVSFEIVVSQHILSFKNTTAQTLNFTRGQPFSTPPFIDDLSLDGHAVAGENVSSIEIDGSSWLTLDNETISLSGVAPDDAGNQNLTITVTDAYQDKVRLDLHLQVSQLFAKGVESCNATIGEEFSYTFDKTLLSDDAVKLDVNLGGLPWAKYDSATMTLSGTVPDDLKPETFPVKLTATQGSTVETRNLNLSIFKPGKAGVVNDQSSSGSSDASKKRKAKIIAIAVSVPVGVAIIAGIILLACCCRRRSKTKNTPKDIDGDLHSRDDNMGAAKSEKTYVQATTSELPRSPSDSSNDTLPMQLPELNLHLDSVSSKEDEEKEEQVYKTPSRGMQPRKPSIEWDVASRDQENINQLPYTSPKRSTSITQVSPLSHRSNRRYSKREPLKPVNNRSFKRDSAMSTKSKRYSRRSSGLSTVTPGLPVRLSGAGHGAGGIGLARPELARASWQTTQMSFQSDDTSIENLSTMFPRPPPVRKRDSSNMSRSRDHSKRVSLRAGGTASPTPPEPDSFEAFIQSRARSRNSGNPLFSSRMDSRGSSGYRAIERGRRSSSIAGTSVSASSYVEDRRQSQVRPVSAISASIYGDDHRNSMGRPMSQISEVEALSGLDVPKTRHSPGLVRRYTDAIAQLPRFWSQGSISSARKPESGDSMTGSDDYYDLIDEREDPEGRRQWYRVNSHIQQLADVEETEAEPTEISTPSQTRASRVHRMSLLRTGGQDGSPSSNRHWRLADTQQGRASIEGSDNLHPTTNSSFRGDLAFV